MLEQELKLSVEGAFAPSLPAEGGEVERIEDLSPLDLRATYHDTEDLRLARSGVTLRCRTGDGERPIWTVKLPVGAGVADGREELEFEGDARHVPEAARDVVRALARSEPLVPVARLRTRRRRWLLRDRDGAELAELVDDRVSVLDRGRVVDRFREVEIEGRGIEREALEQLAGVVAGDGVAPAAQTPKVVRALGERASAPADVVVPAAPRPGGPAADAVRAAIATGVRRMILNDPRTRLGEVEPLHQMRVGTRRLRSDLRTFRPLVEEDWAEPLRGELKWVSAALGAVRDLDVLIERLRREGADLAPRLGALLVDLERRREVARERLLASLRSERYIELLDRLVAAAHEPRTTELADRPAREVLPPLVARAWRKLAGAGRPLGEQSTDEEFHRVRVLAKRTRYAAEAVAPALRRGRGRDARRFAKRVAVLQDVLGELQDSVVAARTVEEFALQHRHKGPLGLASGRMLERERRARARARARFPVVWRGLSRKKRRAWLG